MIMGINDHQWYVFDYHRKPTLLYSIDPHMYRKLDASRIKKELLSRGLKVDGLFFYAFSEDGTPKYIFISKKRINFNQIDYIDSEEKAFIVEGALYSVSAKRFIKFSGSRNNKEIFYQFVLYDSGIPHVVYNSKSYNYTVMYIKDKKYVFVDTDVENDLQFVSYVSCDMESLSRKCKRAIFFVQDDVHKMIILKDELYCVIEEDGFTLYDVVYRFSKETSSEDYYDAIHSPNDYSNDKTDGKIALCDNKHLYNDDCIIIKDETGYYSERGNLAIVYFDYEVRIGASFFDYSVSENHILKAIFKTSDFDNGIEYIDLNCH